jgi:MFS family permease
MFQQSMNALGPVINSISEAFPGTPDVLIQIIPTFLSLITVPVALCTGLIQQFINRRKMAIFGIGLWVMSGILGYLFHNRLWLVFLWSGLIGAGTGLAIPVASSLIVDFFDEGERSIAAGRQTVSVNLGGVFLSLLSGILASVAWNCAYLIFLAAIPAFLMGFKYIPRESVGKKAEGVRPGSPEKRPKVPGFVWLCCLQSFIFGIIYSTFPTNISFLMAERGTGGTALSGVITACFMFGGVGFGILFTKIAALMKRNTAIFAFAILAASYAAIYFLDGNVALFIFSFIGGGSLSIFFPYLLVRISEVVVPSNSLLSTSLLITIAPNFGTFLSPIIITNISPLFGDVSVHFRFLTAAAFAGITAAVMLIANARVKHETE